MRHDKRATAPAHRLCEFWYRLMLFCFANQKFNMRYCTVRNVKRIASRIQIAPLSLLAVTRDATARVKAFSSGEV